MASLPQGPFFTSMRMRAKGKILGIPLPMPIIASNGRKALPLIMQILLASIGFLLEQPLLNSPSGRSFAAIGTAVKAAVMSIWFYCIHFPIVMPVRTRLKSNDQSKCR